MDNGPWSVWKDASGRVIGVISDDFRLDVGLSISGDFETDDQREEYARWLASRLNGGR